MAAFGLEDDHIEHTLAQIRLVHVFKIPPRTTSGGHRAGDWKDEVWQGSLKVVEKGGDAAILLTDPKTNTLFAMCPVKEGSVERAVDSSRYFVLKIQNAQGRHAFIGVAFAEREEAFDFNVALQEYQKDKERDALIASGALQEAADNAPKLDLSIKEGEKISIKLPPGASSSGERKKRTSVPLANSGGGLLAPPPGSGGLLAPPPSGARKAAHRSGAGSSDGLFDTDQPHSQPSASLSSTSNDFASFMTSSAPANPQPSSSGFGSFDPLAKSPSSSSSSASNPLDDWTGLSGSLPQAPPARPPNAGGPCPSAPTADPLADLLS